MKPMNEMSLSFLSYSANEGFARATVAAFVAQMDPTVGEISDIKTAVSEAVTNCIIHAYRDVIGMIYISVKIFENGKVVIRIRDKGCGIEDVEKAKEPLYSTGGEERAGLGFMVMESFMDQMKVTSKVGKGTVVVLQKEIERMKNIQRSDIPASLAYVEEDLFEDYLHDLVIIQQFAMLNRQAIADEIMTAMNLHAADQFTTIHNYIDTETMILRKGAVSAKKGEILLIPINMRDGSLICMGKGNPDWNESAPHGAGRLFSRMSARKQFTLEAFKASMEGIYTTSIQPETLDECPMAYKDMNEIIKNIEPTVELIRIIKPIYNFKAGE